MHKELESFALQFAKQANLGDDATQDIHRELLADLDAKYRELMLNGKSSMQAVQTIQREFGESQAHAFELHKVHYPLMRIPLLGELLYYRPFMVAGFLASSYLLIYVFGLSILPELIYKILPNIWLSTKWIWVLTFSMQFVSGVIAYYLSHKQWRVMLEGIAMSIVPYLWLNIFLLPAVSAFGSGGLVKLFLLYFVLYLSVNLIFVISIIPLHQLFKYLLRLK